MMHLVRFKCCYHAISRLPRSSLCERAKMSLFVRRLARLLGLGQALLKIYSDQTLRISLTLCIEVCSTVIEFNVSLWSQIRIADYFPALMLPEA